MENFDSSKYQATIQDVFHDISLNNLSYRGKIILVRSYAEIIVRRLLDMRDKDELHLGYKQTKKALEERGYTEPFFVDALKKIQQTSNDIYHTQKPMIVTEEKWIEIFESLQNLFSYLFYRYFKEFTFGNNPRVMTAFSILPPSIRHITLDALYNDDKSNAFVIEKLLVSKLKAFDFDTAKQWLEKEREHLLSVTIAPLIYNGVVLAPQSNWYETGSNKLETMKSWKPLYKEFADAKEYYIEHGGIEGDTEEIKKFNELMQFVYIGF